MNVRDLQMFVIYKRLWFTNGHDLQTFVIYEPLIKAIKQGRLHGQYQLQTSGQGRKCAFSHLSTHVHGPTDQRNNGLTDGQSLL